MYCFLAPRGTLRCPGYHATEFVLVMLMSNPFAPEATKGDFRRFSFDTALVYGSVYALALAQWPETSCHQAPMVTKVCLSLRHEVGTRSNLVSLTLVPSTLGCAVDWFHQEGRDSHTDSCVGAAPESLDRIKFNMPNGHCNLLEAPSVDHPATCVVRGAVPKGLLNS